MVGKSQPVGSTLGTRNQDGTDFYFIEGRVVKKYKSKIQNSFEKVKN